MKIVTVGSPDRVSIASFLSFMRHSLGKDYAFGEIHSLMSIEETANYIDGLRGIREKILFSYYAKRAINVDPVKVIPVQLMEASDFVVWMDLYSMDWKILKDVLEESGPLLERWKANLSRMSVSPY
jgi:hypothetical protein